MNTLQNNRTPGKKWIGGTIFELDWRKVEGENFSCSEIPNN